MSAYKPSVYNKRNRLRRSLNGVYVGRPSPWGNPFRAGKDGTREEVIAKFEAYALKRLADEPAWLDPLIGKDLICWCAPLPCHADVLLRLANDMRRRHSMTRNNPLLLDDTADAIEKIQRHGYTFAFDINSEKYQVCKDPEATDVLHEFDNWGQIIAFANQLFIQGDVAQS